MIKINLRINKMERNIEIKVGKPGRTFPVFLLLICFAMTSRFSYAKTGDEIFNTSCMTCHALSDKRLTGPGLNGLLERRDADWVSKWIRNSQELINSGDEDAVKIFEEYNKIAMPAFDYLTDDELADLIKYIDENGVAEENLASTGESTSANGNTEEGKGINLMSIFWGILIIGIAVLFAYRLRKRVIREVNHLGVYANAHQIKNYPAIFLIYVLIAFSAIYVLVQLLNNDIGMINQLMFMALPYLAIGIFLVGSIYRYKQKGFKVSSLSSQFLEGKQLFRGSQPFHWGLMVLFFGHLIAFLFPSAIMAWNGEPVRRLILEISSFAFGLSALWGLTLLIIRRLKSKTLLVVTNKMDMVVYTILLTQIISGLGVAFYVRWGSSWFASVLTPYLRSVFSFDPDITAVAEMPWWIQLHIISAFSIIAIIPFTRFMHFLVAPVDYIWRKYQVVIWNWNRKAIRTSTRHSFGKKPRNH